MKEIFIVAVSVFFLYYLGYIHGVRSKEEGKR